MPRITPHGIADRIVVDRVTAGLHRRRDLTQRLTLPTEFDDHGDAACCSGMAISSPSSPLRKGLSPTHAWRHTFNRRAARAGIEGRIRFGFCGHTERDVGDIYATPNVEDLAVEGAKFPRYDV
jgi:hypothetical protein